ncbi:MAG: hypothetical protein LBG27_09730 [Spirochaetaceae bacterium]|nr:hypothetical protein [Spirochaetaceae bacterium]
MYSGGGKTGRHGLTTDEKGRKIPAPLSRKADTAGCEALREPAGALATSLFILGRERGADLLSHFPGAEAVFVLNDAVIKRCPAGASLWNGVMGDSGSSAFQKGTAQ